jgi:hypothetical protein
MSQRWQEDILKVARETFQRWQRETLWRWQDRRDEVSAPTWLLWERHSWMWQERHPGGGKSDVLEVPAPTWLLWERQSWRWKERHLRRGKRDVKRVQDVAIAMVL